LFGELCHAASDVMPPKHANHAGYADMILMSDMSPLTAFPSRHACHFILFDYFSDIDIATLLLPPLPRLHDTIAATIYCRIFID